MPTVRGWFFLLAGPTCLVLAYGTGQNALLVPGALFLGALLVGALLLIPIARNGRIEMRMPLDVREGAGGDILLFADPVYVGSQFRWRSIASGHWTPWTRLTSSKGAIFTGDLARGVYPVQPIRVRVTDPLGVWYYRSKQGEKQQLIVGPQTRSLEAQVQSGFGSQAYANLLGVTDQVDQLVRDHRREDGMRRVHWKQSAKHNRLMARKEEPPSVGTATVVLDTRQASYRDRDEFDAAVRTFASLMGTLHERGLEIRVRESGTSALAPNAGTMRERELVRSLATLEASAGGEVKEPSSRDRVHVITGLAPDKEIAELIATLGRDDAVWGATDAIVEKGRAARHELLPFEAMSLESMLS